MEILNEYIIPVTLVVCLGVGYILKHWIPSNKVNDFIPLILGILGVIITAWSERDISPEILAKGLVSGLASTGVHQQFERFIERFIKKE